MRKRNDRKDLLIALATGAAGKAIVDCASLLPEPLAVMARLALIVVATLLILKY